jgi:hypothetical protein
VIREVARVLRPAGASPSRDVIADPDMDAATRKDMEQWTGCIAGALTRVEFAIALHNAGLDDVEITETHRVHEHAGAAIIRARKARRAPAAAAHSDRRARAAGAWSYLPGGTSRETSLVGAIRRGPGATPMANERLRRAGFSSGTRVG